MTPPTYLPKIGAAATPHKLGERRFVPRYRLETELAKLAPDSPCGIV